MFDFIEEPMASLKPDKKDEAKKIEIPHDSVYTMPEKYIVKKPQTNSPMVLIGLVVLVFIIAISAGVYFYTSNQQRIGQQITTVNLNLNNNANLNDENDENINLENINLNQNINAVNTNQANANTNSNENTNKSVNENTNVNGAANTNTQGSTESQVQYVSSKDTDGDGLTDNEERLFTTDPTKPDTDGDGYTDGNEVSNLYDPTRANGAKLANSGLMTEYKNPTEGYSILYPASWVAQTIKSGNEVMFTSTTGENVSITVDENPANLSALDWLLAKIPASNTSLLQSVSSGNIDGIWSENGMKFYFVKKDVLNNISNGKIYTLSYDLGGNTEGNQKEVNFMTTFKAMQKSFTFLTAN